MEFLSEALGETLYAQVAEKLQGNEKIKLGNLANGEYVAVDKFNAEQTRANGFDLQIKEVKQQFEELKKTAGSNEELQTKLAEIQAKYDKDTQDLAYKLEKQTFDFALDSALRERKARNVKTIKPLLDEAKLTFKEGKLEGLEDQLKEIKENNAFLFLDEVAGGTGGVPNSDGDTGNVGGFDFSKIQQVIK